jgi:hypothetical protein
MVGRMHCSKPPDNIVSNTLVVLTGERKSKRAQSSNNPHHTSVIYHLFWHDILIICLTLYEILH